MIELKPKIVVVHEPFAYWRIELTSLAACRQALGPELLNAFCRCFVQVDRLTTVVRAAYLSRMHYAPRSGVYRCDMQTMVYWAVTALHDLTTEIRVLRCLLADRALLDPKSEAWRDLEALEQRWNDDVWVRSLHDAIGSHVQRDVIERGLAARDGGGHVLAEGQGNSFEYCWNRLSVDALAAGAGMTDRECDRLIDTVGDDRTNWLAIQKVFLLAMAAVGIPLER